MVKQYLIKSKYVFVTVFFLAFIYQGLFLKYYGMCDETIWSSQAQYVETGNALQFDMDTGYGNPGATIIDGVIIVHHLFGLSYLNSLYLFLALFDAFIVAGIGVLCLLIRPGDLWWLVVIPMLLLDRSNVWHTPTSSVASLIVVFFTLFSWWLYEKSEITFLQLAFFGFISGLAISTRADIGAFMTLVLFSLFISKISLKRALIPITSAAVTFIAIDPFMWFMPLRHLFDLLYKVYWHHEICDYRGSSLAFILSYSLLAILSMLLAAMLLFFRNQLRIKLPPPRLLFTLMVATLLLCGIFMTSRFQTLRYYLPIINIWHVFLPLLLFSMISQLRFNFLKTPASQLFVQRALKIFTIIVLVGWSIWKRRMLFNILN